MACPAACCSRIRSSRVRSSYRMPLSSGEDLYCSRRILIAFSHTVCTLLQSTNWGCWYNLVLQAAISTRKLKIILYRTSLAGISFERLPLPLLMQQSVVSTTAITTRRGGGTSSSLMSLRNAVATIAMDSYTIYPLLDRETSKNLAKS